MRHSELVVPANACSWKASLTLTVTLVIEAPAMPAVKFIDARVDLRCASAVSSKLSGIDELPTAVWGRCPSAQ